MYFVFFCFRVFLAGQFEFLHPHLESMIPANKRAFLSQFYSQVNSFWVSQKNMKYHLLWNFIYENIEEFQELTTKFDWLKSTDCEYCSGTQAASLQKCWLKSNWLWSGENSSEKIYFLNSVVRLWVFTLNRGRSSEDYEIATYEL